MNRDAVYRDFCPADGSIRQSLRHYLQYVHLAPPVKANYDADVPRY